MLMLNMINGPKHSQNHVHASKFKESLYLEFLLILPLCLSNLRNSLKDDFEWKIRQFGLRANFLKII
jgi:hypothetical protein